MTPILLGLLQLVPIYAMDAELSSSIIRELMLVSNKTNQEETAIKSTIASIFQFNFNNTATIGGNHASDAHYGVLLELISSQVEGAYDLLSWTVETFFNKQQNSKPAAVDDPTSKQPISSTEFAHALSNYFKASPALIRYGAALALNSLATITTAGQNMPTFLSQNPNMYSYIVQGICDYDFLTSGLYMQLLEALDFGSVDGPIVRQHLSDVRQDSLRSLSYDDLFLGIGGGTEASAATLSENRVKLMEAVAKPAPPLGLAELHKMANTLDFVDDKLKLKHMRLIRVWGRKTTKASASIHSFVY